MQVHFMANGRVLFGNGDLFQFMQQRHKNLLEEIDSLAPDNLLNTNTDDLCDYLVEKYGLEIPQLKPDDITMDKPQEAMMEVRDPFDGHPYNVNGTKFRFFVPYQGDEVLFNYRPSRYYVTYPLKAQIKASELVIEIDRPYTTENGTNDAAQVKQEFDAILGEISQYLAWVSNDLAGLSDL